jgi:DNA-binding CsgD family transcriptional regulator
VSAEAPHLTQREREVLQLIAKGLSYARMAETLGMAETTVTSHIKQIYRKLEVRSRGEAVFEAMQLGLVRPPKA